MIHCILRTLAVPAVAVAAFACAQAQDDGAAGRELFVRHCASCHGPFGEGDGPVAAVMQVPNLRTLSERSGGEFPREAVIRYIDGRELPAAHGERLMPVWGNTFGGDGDEAASEKIAAITDFVEQLQN